MTTVAYSWSPRVSVESPQVQGVMLLEDGGCMLLDDGGCVALLELDDATEFGLTDEEDSGISLDD